MSMSISGNFKSVPGIFKEVSGATQGCFKGNQAPGVPGGFQIVPGVFKGFQGNSVTRSDFQGVSRLFQGFSEVLRGISVTF